MTDTAIKTVRIELPGKFDSWFSGSGIGQGQVDDEIERKLYEAYKASRRINRGKGYLLRVELPVDEYTHEILETLARYGGYCADANYDEAHDTSSDRKDRYSALAEIAAGERVTWLANSLLKALV